MHLRYAVEAGLGDEALRSIAGAQMERILSGDELLTRPGPAASPSRSTRCSSAWSPTS